MSLDCENLEAFLAEDLPPEAIDCFESHLAECEACREAIAQQDWIDALLRSPTRLELEPLPAAMPDAIRTSITLRRGQMRRLACGLAAATVVIAVGWTALNQQARGPANQAIATGVRRVDEPSLNTSPKGTEISEPPRATFVGGPEVLVVPVASRHPNVTIVRVYPAYQPLYSAAADTSDIPTLRELDDSTRTDSFNGG